MQSWWQQYAPGSELAVFVAQVIVRLIVAAVLGGAIGLEREFKHKPAGLRTNMFICIGSAFFTILSDRLASMHPGDHTRIAAQIIPGIGFIGAGSILHSRGSVQGLTTAATIFVVASIGMASGGGLYVPAIFATMVILVALHLLGWAETRFQLKPLIMGYEVVGAAVDEIIASVNAVLDDESKSMQTVQVSRTDSLFRVQFTVDATRQEHDLLLGRLRHLASIQRVELLGSHEHE